MPRSPSPHRAVLVGLAAVAALAGCQAGGSAAAGGRSPSASPVPTLEPSEPFGVAEVTLRGPEGQEVVLPVYVAADPQERAFGLMEREDLPDGTGMVFLFPSESSSAFYMYRTLMPLSIAFYAADGEVVRVLDMEPCASEDAAACDLYPPGAPYVGAIEVEQGWFAEAGVTEGWTVELPGDLPPAT